MSPANAKAKATEDVFEAFVRLRQANIRAVESEAETVIVTVGDLQALLDIPVNYALTDTRIRKGIDILNQNVTIRPPLQRTNPAHLEALRKALLTMLGANH